MLDLGDWQLEFVSGGTLRLDGGTMFGVVPRPVWSRVSPPDEQNRIRMTTRCVLARGHGHVVLVDTGYGSQNPPRQQSQQVLEEGEPLVRSLAARGVAPEQVDLVVFSHLHFDHAGGATRAGSDGRVTCTFPRARYVVARREWQDAIGRSPELRGSYRDDLLACWESEKRLKLVDGERSLLPGLRLEPTGGHTHAHQIVWFETPAGSTVYAADICASRAHLKTMWCLGYDVELLETRRRKAELLARVAKNGSWLLFDHDPDTAGCRIVSDEREEWRVIEELSD